MVCKISSYDSGFNLDDLICTPPLNFNGNIDLSVVSVAARRAANGNGFEREASQDTLRIAVAPVAIYVAMPFFRQIDATSAYEYLSKRFNMSVRLFASGLFTLFHIGRMGIVMALTALALSAVTPLTASESVLIMGVLCLIYCEVN